MQNELIGINGAWGIVGMQWDLPDKWQPSPRLRVLKVNGAQNQALESLSFPGNSKLLLLHLNWWVPYHLSVEVRQCPRQVPHSFFQNLKHLRLLYLQHAFHLEYLPDELGDELPCLRKLVIEDAHKLQHLPSSLGRMSHLEGIRLRDCRNLTGLPSSLTKLGKLRLLHMSAGRARNFYPILTEEQQEWLENHQRLCKSRLSTRGGVYGVIYSSPLAL